MSSHTQSPRRMGGRTNGPRTCHDCSAPAAPGWSRCTFHAAYYSGPAKRARREALGGRFLKHGQDFDQADKEIFLWALGKVTDPLPLPN